MMPAASRTVSSSPSIVSNVMLPAPQPAVSLIQLVALLLSNVSVFHLLVYLQPKSLAGVMPVKLTTAEPMGAVRLGLAASLGLEKKTGRECE